MPFEQHLTDIDCASLLRFCFVYGCAPSSLFFCLRVYLFVFPFSIILTFALTIHGRSRGFFTVQLQQPLRRVLPKTIRSSHAQRCEEDNVKPNDLTPPASRIDSHQRVKA